MTDPASSGHDELSFDRAIPTSGAVGMGRDATVRCSVCQRTITASYHTVNDAPVCDSCRTTITALTAPVREPGPIALALLLGFGASLVGAVIYWAVIRISGWELSIITLLNGWMIGKAMRTGAGGRGGRVLQVAAALLTYVSVGMAYHLYMVGTNDSLGLGSLLRALTLPLDVIVGSLPGGLLSALIIGIGMMQAWRLTGTPAMDIQGPFRVGTAPPA